MSSKRIAGDSCCVFAAVLFALLTAAGADGWHFELPGIDFSIETGSTARADAQTGAGARLIADAGLRLESAPFTASAQEDSEAQQEANEPAGFAPVLASLIGQRETGQREGGAAASAPSEANVALRQTVVASEAQGAAPKTSAISAVAREPEQADIAPPLPRIGKAQRFAGILASANSAPNGGRTLAGTLSLALDGSRQLAAARAQLRATSEALPQARAPLLPTLSGTASLGASRSLDKLNGSQSETSGETAGFGLELGQTLFDGFRAQNNMAAARAQILGAQASYANLRQTVLLAAATAHMSVLRDRKVAALRRANLAFLDEQLRSAKIRFDIGEGTATDVAQSESQRALATALLETARADVAASEAAYEEVVGAPPGGLASAAIPNGMLPASLKAAQASAQNSHPAIRSAQRAADTARSQVGAAESGRLPSLNLTASLKDNLSADNKYAPGLPGVSLERRNQASASVGLKLVVPFFAGGKVSSEIRQAKETFGQRRIEVDRARFQVRAAVATAWARLQAAQANVKGFRTRVEAAQIALDGVSQEMEIGQRTTLDVLNAQAEVISGEVLLVDAERDLVVFAHALSAAMGRLLPDQSGATASNAIGKKAKSSMQLAGRASVR